MKYIISIIFSIMLVGCGTNPVDLQPVKNKKAFILNEGIEQTGVYGPLKVQWTEGLISGTYVPLGSDEFGTFYLGPKFCFYKYNDMGVEPKKFMDGGIIIPHKKNDSLHLFYIVGETATVNAEGIYQSANIAGSHSNATSMEASIGGAIGVSIGQYLAELEKGNLIKDREIQDIDTRELLLQLAQ